MIKQILISFFILTILSFSYLETKVKIPLFSTHRIKRAYINLLDTKSELNTDAFISVNDESIHYIADTVLMQVLPDHRFYFIEMYNGSHWEYNNGKIPVVAGINVKDTNDAKLMLPQDYCKNSTRLLDYFLNKKYENNKVAIGNSISKMFFLSHRRNLNCCEKEIRNFKQTNTWKGDTLIINTAYEEKCCKAWLKAENEVLNDYTTSKPTKFIFKGNKLVSVIGEEWK